MNFVSSLGFMFVLIALAGLGLGILFPRYMKRGNKLATLGLAILALGLVAGMVMRLSVYAKLGNIGLYCTSFSLCGCVLAMAVLAVALFYTGQVRAVIHKAGAVLLDVSIGAWALGVVILVLAAISSALPPVL
jgi:hypothetical protein